MAYATVAASHDLTAALLSTLPIGRHFTSQAVYVSAKCAQCVFDQNITPVDGFSVLYDRLALCTQRGDYKGYPGAYIWRSDGSTDKRRRSGDDDTMRITLNNLGAHLP